MEPRTRGRRLRTAGPKVPWIIRACVPAVAMLLAVAGGTAAAPRHEHDPMMMVGNDQQYPDLGKAGARNVARARAVLRASLATMHRFDTIAKAKRLGYTSSPQWFFRPGFSHWRKNHSVFWGRMFD